MIITQTHKRRTFVGSMNTGTDLVESLLKLCVDNTIFCGLFNAVGYLQRVSLRAFDAKKKRYTDPTMHEGTFHAIAITGNVSLIERQTAVRCHVIGTLTSPSGQASLISGELVSGEVISVEFSLGTLDDIRLYRALDERTGLDPWLHVEFGDGPLPRADDKREIPTIAQPTSAVASASRPAPAPMPRDAQELDIGEGDFLNHPTLGRCIVVEGDGDDRLKIKLESGRVVELHLGLLELTPLRTDTDGQRTFKVSIRRRR